MKKIILFLVLALVLSFSSCEKDDICIDPITPNLIIRFYDNTDANTLKSVANLQIKNTDIDSIFTDNIVATDSITIPLNAFAENTTYQLTINSTDTNTANSDTLKISYTREDVFVSRSCGFKTIFKDVSLSVTSDTNNWIKSALFIDDTNAILNETQAHVKILH